jgi:single-strand DNA-binding protein
MSSGVNKVILIGGLVKDPELRATTGANAQAVTTLRLAMTERRKDGDGWKDHVEYADVVVWGKTAENCCEYLRKGRQVYVEGSLQTRSYKDKDDRERWVTEVKAREVLFLGGGNDEDRRSGGPSHTTRGAR